MTAKSLLALAAVIVLSQGVAGPQATKRMPILVSATTDDTLGSRVVYQLRDKLASSPRYQLATAGQKALTINIVSIDTDKDSPGSMTAMSIVFEVPASSNCGSYILNQYVQVIGAQRVEVGADNILASLDRDIANITSK